MIYLKQEDIYPSQSPPNAFQLSYKDVEVKAMGDPANILAFLVGIAFVLAVIIHFTTKYNS